MFLYAYNAGSSSRIVHRCAADHNDSYLLSLSNSLLRYGWRFVYRQLLSPATSAFPAELTVVMCPYLQLYRHSVPIYMAKVVKRGYNRVTTPLLKTTGNENES